MRAGTADAESAAPFTDAGRVAFAYEVHWRATHLNAVRGMRKGGPIVSMKSELEGRGQLLLWHEFGRCFGELSGRDNLAISSGTFGILKTIFLPVRNHSRSTRPGIRGGYLASMLCQLSLLFGTPEACTMRCISKRTAWIVNATRHHAPGLMQDARGDPDLRHRIIVGRNTERYRAALCADFLGGNPQGIGAPQGSVVGSDSRGRSHLTV
jgi:hypothetical protein